MAQKNPGYLIAALFCFTACPEPQPIDKPLPPPADGGGPTLNSDAGVSQTPPTLFDAGINSQDAGLDEVVDSGQPDDAGIEPTPPCIGCIRSALYPVDWAPNLTSPEGYFLHDFSYAGYHQSEKELPEDHDLDVFYVTDYGADASGGQDSTASIQNAINAAQDNGGGLVFFSQGEYLCESNLTITHSHIVLRGHSLNNTKLIFNQTLPDGGANIQFKGSLVSGAHLLLAETEQAMLNAAGRCIVVADSSKFGRKSLTLVAGLDAVNAVISDNGLSEEWQTFVRKTCPQLVIAEVPSDSSSSPASSLRKREASIS